MSVDALVAAGGIPKPDDPLYEFTQGQSKAMLDIAGQPMAQWVLNALGASQYVDNVVIVGLDESSGLKCKKPLHFIPNQGGILENIRGATRKIVEINPKAEYVLIASSDVPAVTPEMVDWIVEQTQSGDEMVFNMVERELMETRFPDSKRTFTKLKGIEVCGGDMNVVGIDTILAENSIWDRLTAVRKNPLKQAALVGFDTLLLVLLRLVDVEGAAKRVSKNLGLQGRGVLCPYPEVAMDVDKVHHLESVRKDLEAAMAK